MGQMSSTTRNRFIIGAAVAVFLVGIALLVIFPTNNAKHPVPATAINQVSPNAALALSSGSGAGGSSWLDSLSHDTRLSAIVLVGFAVTVSFMILLAVVYSAIGITNRDQALGLPDGSVRALLAFSLVLIFVCMAAFLFSQVNDTSCEDCGKTLAGVNDLELNELKANFVVAAEPDMKDGVALYEQTTNPKYDPAKPADAVNKPTIDDPKHPLYTVTYYPKPNKDATDFAKQIFTTLGTIFVSVVSFYFGSSVSSSATKAATIAAQAPSPDRNLIAALADSHNAQAVRDQALKASQLADEELAKSPSDSEKQALAAAAKKALADAEKALSDKQTSVTTIQKASGVGNA